MAQSYNLRQGWQSENLAKYLLSKVAFVSQPVTISDDVGSDFVCTLFEIEKIGTQDYLIPRNAFAIQTKSDSRNKLYEITDKEPYIRQLEIPFFWGIVDKTKGKITIYSGEFFEIFIHTKGGVEREKGQKLFLKLTDVRDESVPFYKEDNSYYILFPKVIEISTNSDSKKINKEMLFKTCSLMLKNIAARIKEAYILELFSGNLFIIYGPNSAKACRSNFYKALAETFKNLPFLYTQAENKVEIRKEFEIYKRLFNDLYLMQKPLPYYLKSCYSESRNFFDNQPT